MIAESRDKGTPHLLVSTDRTLSTKQILEIYAARFSLEIAIRDLKEEFELSHYQFQKPQVSAVLFIWFYLFAPFGNWSSTQPGIECWTGLLKVKPESIIREYGSFPIKEAPLS